MTKQKTLTLKAEGISSKQWTNLVIELNLIAKAWRPYGVNIKLQAPGIKNMIAWGRRINESYKN